LDAEHDDEELEKKNETKGRPVEEIKLEAPNLTEEDNHGPRLPKQYECDACHAIVHQISAALTKATENAGKNKKLKEWEYSTVFDDTCSNGMGEYGVSQIDGKTVLQGPGIPDKPKSAAGSGSIKMGGGKWPNRMKEMCIEMIAEIGEEEIYNLFNEDKFNSKDFCKNDDLKYCKKQKKKEKKENKEKKGKDKEPSKKKVDKSAKVTVTQFLEEQEKLFNAGYSEFTKLKSHDEWLKLFNRIAEHKASNPKDEL